MNSPVLIHIGFNVADMQRNITVPVSFTILSKFGNQQSNKKLRPKARGS